MEDEVIIEMTEEATCSFPGPVADGGFNADDADPRGDSGPSEASLMGERPDKPVESPPTSSTPKKMSFSISSILDNDVKQLPDLQQTAGDRLDTSTVVTGPSRSESAQLTFFYRDQLLSSQKTPPGESGCSADALISSWTVPPTSPLIYRKSSCSSVLCMGVATGIYRYIGLYIPSQNQAKQTFLWSNYGARTVTKLIPQ